MPLPPGLQVFCWEKMTKPQQKPISLAKGPGKGYPRKTENLDNTHSTLAKQQGKTDPITSVFTLPLSFSLSWCSCPCPPLSLSRHYDSIHPSDLDDKQFYSEPLEHNLGHFVRFLFIKEETWSSKHIHINDDVSWASRTYFRNATLVSIKIQSI